ncbi:MAG: Fic family protein [Gammaproteobacteria bacterium]|nr:Fic family protein [Gammaproteobacteria bacterium]
MKKKVDLKVFILELLYEKKESTLREIAKEAGLSVEASADRRIIQRALASLIQEGAIQAQGKARSRVYLIKSTLIKKINVQPFSEYKDVFRNIPLSEKSVELLRYVSEPIQTREPARYNQNFLISYVPNQTAYLSPALRSVLFAAGSVENIMRSAGTYARHMLNRLLIDLSWNSSRLEGNTYSLLETKRLIEFGENAAGKNIAEAQMILNHKNAIEYIVDSANEVKISAHDIYSIHALLSENLLGDPSASGRVREIAVGISGTTYLPLENPHIIKECFDVFIEKVNLIEDPFEKSFFSLVQLSYMQAFEDINKRTARLVANIPLINKNLKPLSFVDVNQKDYFLALIGVYEKNDISLFKNLFVWAYERSAQRYSAIQQNIGEPDLFKIKYRSAIQEIIREIILDNVTAHQIVPMIKNKIERLKLSESDFVHLFQIIETEIMSLHDGNIARFKVRPGEFEKWKSTQNPSH